MPAESVLGQVQTMMVEMMLKKLKKKSLISQRTLVLHHRARSKRHQGHQERNVILHLSTTLVPSTDHLGSPPLHLRHAKPRQP
jgi:hypothetical protein